MHSIPTLRTDRLLLVPPAKHHEEALAALHADAQTMRQIGSGRPLDRVESWLLLATLIGHWKLRGYGTWVMEDADGRDVVGRVGLLHPDGWPEPELNWLTAPWARRRGFASEAARVVLDFAFEELGFESVISLVRPANTVSARLAEKLGGFFDRTIDFMNGPMHVFRYARVA